LGQIGKDALRHVLAQMGIAIDEAHRCREHQVQVTSDNFPKRFSERDRTPKSALA
jgi:hypothetical protein